MNLKDIFTNAEDGKLTYEQFVAAAGKSKFVDLTEGNYVDRQKYTDDLAARDTRITSLDETLKNRDTDLANLQKQLETAGTDSARLSELNTQLSDLQKQYEKDTKAYQKQLKDQSYKFAVTEFANKQEFTSQAAKREFERAMVNKGLQMEGDIIIGATDFLTAYKQDNADSFKVEEPAPGAEPPKPHFAGPTSGGDGGKPEDISNAFSSFFNFQGVRPH